MNWRRTVPASNCGETHHSAYRCTGPGSRLMVLLLLMVGGLLVTGCDTVIIVPVLVAEGQEGSLRAAPLQEARELQDDGIPDAEVVMWFEEEPLVDRVGPQSRRTDAEGWTRMGQGLRGPDFKNYLLCWKIRKEGYIPVEGKVRRRKFEGLRRRVLIVTMEPDNE